MQSLIHVTVTSMFLLCSGSAVAVCNITDLPCWGDDTKCNIKFRNLSGLAEGSGGGTPWNQTTLAATIRVTANLPNSKNGDDKQVGNGLQILAGQSKTINLDKHQGFDHIQGRIMDGSSWTGFVMKCAAVREVLKGKGNCKMFRTTDGKYDPAFNCNGGSVVGSGDHDSGPVWYLDDKEQ